MTRFGDFSLLEDLGRSPVADRYKAMHATQGGPFFLKVYSRLDARLHPELLQRCDALIGRTHPNLARHLGHGVVDGLPFVVAPYLEGIDLAALSTSLLDRRVTIGLESMIMVLADLAAAVGALHSARIGANGDARALAHGDVSIGHVRLGPEGQTWLTGLTTPRGDGKLPEVRLDIAGVGALAYDLVPLLRGGAARPPLPPPLDRVVRRALGIGTAEDRIQPEHLCERLGEVGQALKLKTDRTAFAELVRRTVRAVERRSQENGGRLRATGTTPAPGTSKPRLPADAIPSLDPVDRLPSLEPVSAKPAPKPPVPAAQLPQITPPPSPPPIELVPISGNEEGLTELVVGFPVPLGVPPALTPAIASTGPAVPPPARELPPVLSASGRAPAAPRAGTPPPSPATASQWTHTSRRPLDARTAPTSTLGAGMNTGAVPRAPASAAASVSDDPFAPAPHTDPRTAVGAQPHALSQPSPVSDSDIEALPPDLPDDIGSTPAFDAATPYEDEPPIGFRDAADKPAVTSPSPAAAPLSPPVSLAPSSSPRSSPPSLPRGAATADRTRTDAGGPAPPPIKKPLLADPDEGGASAKSLQEPTRDATDPDQKSTRAEAARRDPAVRALLTRALVTDAALQAAIEDHAQRGGRVVEILVAAGVLSDAQVAEALAAESGRPLRSDEAVRATVPQMALVRRLPQTYVLARRVLPLSLDHGQLSVAMADPFDQGTIDELKTLLNAGNVDVVVAARAAITAATVEAYRSMGIGGMPGAATNASTVLLCTPDDGKAARIGARLAQEGMRVEHVVDGDAARQILATRPPNVVICAHDLPGKSTPGSAIAALLLFVRELPATLELPFFVFGPRGDEALATRVLDLGADDYLSEPLKLEVLLAKVRRVVGKGRLSAEGLPLNDPSGAFRTMPPVQSSDPFGAPPFLDEQTPVTAIPLPPPVQQKRQEPSFIENIAMPSLDDLPELPPDFSGGEAPDTPPAMPTGVMGTLRQMALPEIVQSLEMGRKTATVDLVPSDGQKGMIAFETGQIRYAECGALRGEDAFYQLARHTEGFFRIHYGTKPPEVNITHQTTFLLLEAMRRMDEEGQDLSGS